jgi:inosine/xanthosine triphosphatase
MTTLLAVGSRNPAKLNAVRDGAVPMLGDIHVIGVEVESGVRAQPFGDVEMIAGATQRARAALAVVPDARFGVGLEGGCTELQEGLFASAWCVVIDRAGQVGWASTGHFQLPPRVAELVRGGMELGDADDIVFGRNNSKHNVGSIGLLTHGKSTRAQFYAPTVTRALIKFVNTDLFHLPLG